MTVKAVQIKTSVEKDVEADDSNLSVRHGRPERLPARMIKDVVRSVGEEIAGQNNPLSEKPVDKDTGRPKHVRGLRRFSELVDEEKLLDRIEEDVVCDCEWYEIRTHVCDHDLPDAERTGCGDWENKRTKGNVPEEV